jgi:hypothetical protein
MPTDSGFTVIGFSAEGWLASVPIVRPRPRPEAAPKQQALRSAAYLAGRTTTRVELVRRGFAEQPLAPTVAAQRLPGTLGLGQPVGHRQQHDRIQAQAQVAGLDLDVLRKRPLAFDAVAPRHDAVAAAVDRTGGNRRRLAQRS